MTNFDESSPFDPAYDGYAIDPEHVLGWDGVYQGWDKEQRDRWDNCAGTSRCSQKAPTRSVTH